MATDSTAAWCFCLFQQQFALSFESENFHCLGVIQGFRCSYDVKQKLPANIENALHNSNRFFNGEIELEEAVEAIVPLLHCNFHRCSPGRDTSLVQWSCLAHATRSCSQKDRRISRRQHAKAFTEMLALILFRNFQDRERMLNDLYSTCVCHDEQRSSRSVTSKSSLDSLLLRWNALVSVQPHLREEIQRRYESWTETVMSDGEPTMDLITRRSSTIPDTPLPSWDMSRNRNESLQQIPHIAVPSASNSGSSTWSRQRQSALSTPVSRRPLPQRPFSEPSNRSRIANPDSWFTDELVRPGLPSSLSENRGHLASARLAEALESPSVGPIRSRARRPQQRKLSDFLCRVPPPRYRAPDLYTRSEQPRGAITEISTTRVNLIQQSNLAQPGAASPSIFNLDRDTENSHDWSRESNESSPFTSYWSQDTQLTPREAINDTLDLLEIPVDRNARSGYIYAFELPDHPGYIKIGREFERGHRIPAQSRSCYGLVKRIPDERVWKTPYVARAEQLIHSELSRCRMRYKCSNCKRERNTFHREWFLINRNEAFQVIDRWRDWLNEERPYGKDGRLTARWNKRLSSCRRGNVGLTENTRDRFWKKCLRKRNKLECVLEYVKDCLEAAVAGFTTLTEFKRRICGEVEYVAIPSGSGPLFPRTGNSPRR
ncbi:hypothetical protein L228DRAFT_22507 [Xylona heveae TC161]|uniref:Bacteriophage T5 Orf172 DNA-binding domain-containing protein n=1 Tax=Xylona heveae (strain CBS 132557 / TC161) TaxID=1328760 RepID=A0A165K3K1_XYLHT|nr:hypothetical protein L228DRAFT_22507 [Xylona heveae TC161]KZF26947.1 hypothetical protein L228DRAFT_22507 [Xylona heveae TC161]